MFLSGADGQTPELRPPSIKGALRFWWRAMNGHLSLEELKKKEDEIFGGTEGRSKVVIQKITCQDIISSYDEFNHTFPTYEGNERKEKGKAFQTNAMYYLGYGVANWVKEDKRTRFVRPYIPAGFEFVITFRVKEDFVDDLLLSFKALEQFGSLGSKARNAFGCFYIKRCELKDKTDHTDKAINIDSIKLDKFKNSLNSLTCFSNTLCFFETKKSDYENWEKAFKDIAIAYQYARERTDENWHEWDNRELIALPIVVKGEREINDNFLERHSKPYFLHITKLAEKKYKGEVLLLPYAYLKDCPEIIGKKDFDNIQDQYIEILKGFNSLLSEKLILKLNGLNNV